MRSMLRASLIALLASVVCSAADAQPEFRGIWVDAFHPGFKNHDQVTQMVNWAKATNLNALIVQVRKRGDAYYNSHLEPRASDIAGDYDPLADVIAQAHAAKLEVHAWLSVFDIMHDSKWYKPGPTHIYRAHPEWLMSKQDGGNVFAQGKIYLDPGVPAVQDHVVSVVSDIVSDYQVDGINLDNFRYPGAEGGYNPISISLFNQQLGRTGTPDEKDAAWCQWRRDQVTGLLRRLQAAVVKIKPKVKLSACAMTHDAELAADMVLQDWDTWTREGLLDFLIPMIFIGTDQMDKDAPVALKSSYGRHVYIGIGSWRLSPQFVERYVEDARTAGAKGVVLFSYHYLGPNSPQAVCAKGEDLVSSVFPQPEEIPPMPWKQ